MPNDILDVDETIINRNLLLPEIKHKSDEFDNFIRQNAEGSDVENTPLIVFTPLPGMCIKTKTEDDVKVFVNICHTSHVPVPEDISEESLMHMLDDEIPEWCIPMSIGHEKFESSKNGDECSVFDIAINSDYFKKLETSRIYLEFTIMVMLSAIESKYDKILDVKKYVVLKNRKVMGKLHDHRVQKRKIRKPTIPKPLIEEIPDKLNSNRVKDIEKSAVSFNSLVSQNNAKYIILKKHSEQDGEVEKLIGYFKLPNQCMDDEVDVYMNDDRIVVEILRFDFLVDIFLPYTLRPNQSQAKIDSNFQILTLEVPISM